ncbi:hypothetical protein [Gluconobacter cerinus]|uniref:hypothetical protein n=1 Tax=Gluconobacter cerinus TaxID=38307 RepID=UPI001B8CDA61|nr:hypothetical protein [Gluconobacter cerinus]MBS1035562.1 hypothetical protein [Gluconobacter cerinus]
MNIKKLDYMSLKDLKKYTANRLYAVNSIKRIDAGLITKEQFIKNTEQVLNKYNERRFSETYEIYKDIETVSVTEGCSEFNHEITGLEISLYYREIGSSQFFVEVYDENGDLLTKEEIEEDEVFGTRIYGKWKTAKQAKNAILKGLIK